MNRTPRAGGHDIPGEVVRRRFEAGLRNLFKLYLPAVDKWFVWDASFVGEPQFIAKGGSGVRLEVSPLWEQLKERYGT